MKTGRLAVIRRRLGIVPEATGIFRRIDAFDAQRPPRIAARNHSSTETSHDHD